MIKGHVHKFNGRWVYYVINESTRVIEYQGTCTAWISAFNRAYGLVATLRPEPRSWPSHSRTSTM